MRFAVRRGPLFVPFLLPFGGTRDRSYLELTDDELIARFGWLFHHRFPLAEVESAKARRYSFLGGVGWRTNLLGGVGLIGDISGIVEVRFKRSYWVRMGLPVRCNRLAVSLEDPEGFLEALAARGVAADGP